MKGGHCEMMTMTDELLAELAAATTYPNEPPDGFATAVDICSATGWSMSGVLGKARDGKVDHVIIQTPGLKPCRAYNVAQLLAHVKRGRVV